MSEMVETGFSHGGHFKSLVPCDTVNHCRAICSVRKSLKTLDGRSLFSPSPVLRLKIRLHDHMIRELPWSYLTSDQLLNLINQKVSKKYRKTSIGSKTWLTS